LARGDDDDSHRDDVTRCRSLAGVAAEQLFQDGPERPGESGWWYGFGHEAGQQGQVVLRPVIVGWPAVEGSEEGSVALAHHRLREETGRVMNSRSASSASAGYRFPGEVIAVAVRRYLRYGLSYRDVEELLAERGINVDQVTVYRWVQTFTPELIDAARPARHATGARWFVDEVRHEALWIRVGVRDLHRRAVAAGRLQLGAA